MLMMKIVLMTLPCIKSFGAISTNYVLEVSSYTLKVTLDGFYELVNFLKSLFIISSLHFWKAGCAVGLGPCPHMIWKPANL